MARDSGSAAAQIRVVLRQPGTMATTAQRLRHPDRTVTQIVRDTEPVPGHAGVVLEARGLTKRFGDVTALDNLDLAIGPGEVFCLLGANGAGKTTTINLFLNFIEPTAGSAHIAGLDVAQHSLESKRHVAYIPETVMLYRNLSGVENLEYFASLATGRRFSTEELVRFLTQAGLPADAVARRVGEYSKGMRQKVGIAIALAKKSRALLLDEPTSGLDPKASNEFSALLGMMRERGAAILMATHDLFRAKESGTRVGIMKHGRLVQTLSTADIGHTDLERLYLEHMRD
jgi:ABC-2 type transport system ATP-binding protein